jgi:4-aminobutyrate aminotransferase / (S)-3-amino-2-methylpropionate transaminase / 5-aminovalerate transaminase
MGTTKVLLINSGAEAVENAVKIARQATGRPAVICFSESFHGRTLMGMSLTSKVSYKKGCGPFAPGDLPAPLPEPPAPGRRAGRWRTSWSGSWTGSGTPSPDLVAAQDVAAIIIEPVQGEGGFVPAPGVPARACARSATSTASSSSSTRCRRGSAAPDGGRPTSTSG